MNPDNPSHERADDSGDQLELQLAPPSGKSPQQRESIAKIYPAVDPAPQSSTERPFQFPLWTFFLLTLAAAIGMAGSQWLPAKIFAGLLALIANLVVFGFEFSGTNHPLSRLVVLLVLVASSVAIGVALWQ